jgi:hypothetical protein
MHCPLPEERPSEGTKSSSRRAPGPAVDLEAGALLKALDAAACRGAGDPVDRAGVEAVSAQRHLQAGHLRIDARRGGWCKPRGGCDECEQAKETALHLDVIGTGPPKHEASFANRSDGMTLD